MSRISKAQAALTLACAVVFTMTMIFLGGALFIQIPIYPPPSGVGGGIGQRIFEPPISGGPGSQRGYAAGILRDRHGLFGGRLLLPQVPFLEVGRSYGYVVVVEGDLKTAKLPRSASRAEPVSIGGAVSIKLTCFGLACHPLSSPRQNVVSRMDKAFWEWQIFATRPGTATMYVRVTTYDRGTSKVLAEIPPIRQDFVVKGTPVYYFDRLTNWTKALIGLVGAGTLGGLIAGAWKRFRRKGQNAKKSDIAHSSPVSAAVSKNQACIIEQTDSAVTKAVIDGGEPDGTDN
jgi:hypothetical protein